MPAEAGVLLGTATRAPKHVGYKLRFAAYQPTTYCQLCSQQRTQFKQGLKESAAKAQHTASVLSYARCTVAWYWRVHTTAGLLQPSEDVQ